MTLAVPLETPAASGPEEGPERSDLWSYLARKVGAAAVSFFMLLVIGFVIFNLMPADPVSALTRGRPTSDAQMETLRHQLGLDQPLWERFLHFVGNTLTGDLGYSYEYHQSVASLIADRLWPTLLLMGTSTLISIWLGLWLGIRAGWRPGSALDRSASAVSLALWSVPTFWLGLILLVLFGSGSVGGIPALFPAGGMQSAESGSGLAHVTDVAWHLVLPCLTLVAVIFAQYVTIMRTSIIDERGNPYLLTARAKGLRDEVVRRRHAVPNALLPSVTVIFLQIGTMIGGAITVEVVYSWPGLGYLTFTALRIPDLQLLQGTFIVFSAAVIVSNLVADLLYRALDPRVRRQ
ncbi:ABC transporter permease [Nocardioides sp. MAHUQ-72]|uniref:ABC transporter permease n=1 Tax=unclassified Nocardioides TaxID=2615069 RepID=UPI0036141062